MPLILPGCVATPAAKPSPCLVAGAPHGRTARDTRQIHRPSLTVILDLGGYGWSRSCPTIAAVDMGKWGRFELDGAPACTIANLIGNILVALSLLFSVRYMFA